MEKLVEMMQLQLQQHREETQAQEQRFREQAERQRADMQAMLQLLTKPAQSGQVLQPATSSATPSFSPFDSTSELWKDYWSRFLTFTRAHAVPDDREAQVFLTNQSSTVYKLLSNLAAQETPLREINDLTTDQIVAYMKVQCDPTRFVIRERFKFWTAMQRRPGESIQELAARIRQAAATCDVASVTDRLDEALGTRFICSVNNEAVIALFKMKADEFDFTTAIQVAIQTEDAAKLRRRRSTAQNPFWRWRLRRHRLDYSQCFSALPRKCQLDCNDATVVAIQAISQLRASSKMQIAISAN